VTLRGGGDRGDHGEKQLGSQGDEDGPTRVQEETRRPESSLTKKKRRLRLGVQTVKEGPGPGARRLRGEGGPEGLKDSRVKRFVRNMRKG